MKKIKIDAADITYNAEDPKEDRGYTVTFYGYFTNENYYGQLCYAYVSHMSVDPETMLPFFVLSLDPVELDPDDLTEEVEEFFNEWANENIFKEGTDFYNELEKRAQELRS